MHPDGTSRGFAHVEFLSKEDAIRVIESDRQDPMYMLNRSLGLDYATPRNRRKLNDPYHTLYIYDFRGKEEDLQEIFNEFSESIKRWRLRES